MAQKTIYNTRFGGDYATFREVPMQKQPIHSERSIRAGWPELLPLTALAVCLLFGLFTLATSLPRGFMLCGLGLLGGLLLYFGLYRRGPQLPANALPFLAASGVGYLCLLTLPQLEGLGAAACLLAGLGLPAVLLPLLTLSSVGFDRMGVKGLLAMLGSALLSVVLLLYLRRACEPEMLLTAVGFLALLLLLGVFSLMPALSGAVTIYMVEQKEGGEPKPLVMPRPVTRPAPAAEEIADQEEDEAFAPFQPPSLMEVLAEQVERRQGEPAEEPVAPSPAPYGEMEEDEEEPPEPDTPIFAALLDDFARQQQQESAEQPTEDPLEEDDMEESDQPPATEEADELPQEGDSLFAAMLREARQHIDEVQPELDLPRRPNPFYDVLSEKERQLAGLILQGYTESTIAATMGITVNTQKSYRKNLYNKLEIHAKRELFELAARHDFTGEQL